MKDTKKRLFPEEKKSNLMKSCSCREKSKKTGINDKVDDENLKKNIYICFIFTECIERSLQLNQYSKYDTDVYFS